MLESMLVMVDDARLGLQGRLGLSRSNDGGGRKGGITGFNVSLDMWGGLMSCNVTVMTMYALNCISNEDVCIEL